MIADIITIMLKEWREFLVQRGSLRGNTLSLLIIVGFLGILPPLHSGAVWITSPGVLILSVWSPFLLVSSVVPDSFAGERERHTLETLLATRLSDRAILFGKILAAVGYGWVLTLMILAIGLITVNFAISSNGFIFYPITICVGAVIFCILGAGLASGVGVLISLRAPTVRHAHQVLTATGMLLLLLPVIGAIALPKSLKMQIVNIDLEKGLILSIVVLVMLNLIFLSAAIIKFRRTRLILD